MAARNLWAGITPALNAVSASLATLPGMRSTISGQVRGTFVLTIQHQVRKVGGTDWTPVAMENVADTTDTESATMTAPGLFQSGDLAGEWEYRQQITAFTSATSLEAWCEAEV